MSKIGVNILGGGAYDEPRLMAWLDRLLPPAVVVMNNGALCGRIATRYPEMIVVHRHWPDDSACSTVTPQERWRVLTAYSPSLSNVYLYSQNEPESSARCAAWECALMDIAAVQGRRLVVGNFGMGGPQDAEWRGPLRPLLERLAGSMHLLGLHEYFDYHNWRAAGYDPLAGDNWLIGRFGRMFAACGEMGIFRPRVLITEHGSDSLFDAYHGWRAGAELEYDTQLIEMDAQVYGPTPEIVGTCVFCWDETGGKWETFNIKDAPELRDALARYAEQERGIVDLENRERVVVAPKLEYANIRDTANGADIGDLVGAEYAARTVETENAGGLTWRHYRFEFVRPDGLECTVPDGWMADSAVEVSAAPLPEPEPEPLPEPMTDEQWLVLMRAWYDSLRAFETIAMELRGVLVETWPQLEDDDAA